MKRFVLGIFAAGFCTTAFADINDDMTKLSEDAAKSYISPVVSAIGSDMNKGWFTRAPKPELWGLDLGAKLVATGTFFSSSNKTFSTSTTTALTEEYANTLADQLLSSNSLYSSASSDQKAQMRAPIVAQLVTKKIQATVSGPTILGSTDRNVQLTITSNSTVTIDGSEVPLQGQTVDMGISGVDLGSYAPGVPLPVIQLDVGTLAGTQLAIRFLPSVGDFSYFGVGVNHNPGFWFDKAQLPFGINTSVNFAYSKMSYGDYLDFSAWNAGLMASKRLGFRFLHLEPFAGIGIEGSSLKASYTTAYEVDGKPLDVSFEQDGENLFNATVGTNLRLGILDASASYTLAKNSSIALSVGFGI